MTFKKLKSYTIGLILKKPVEPANYLIICVGFAKNKKGVKALIKRPNRKLFIS